MTVRVDAIGNIRGVLSRHTKARPRRHEDATKHEATKDVPRFYIGSHLDTVPNAGAFDGVLGVDPGAWRSSSCSRRSVSICDRGRRILRRRRRAIRRAVSRQPRAGRHLRHRAARSHRRGGKNAARRHPAFRPRAEPHPGRAGAGQRAWVSRVSHRARARPREPQPAACRCRCDFRSEPRRADVRGVGRACRDDADEDAERRAGVCRRMDQPKSSARRSPHPGSWRRSEESRSSPAPATSCPDARPSRSTSAIRPIGMRKAAVERLLEGGRGNCHATRADDDVRAAPRSAIGCDGSVHRGDARTRGRAGGCTAASHVERRRTRRDGASRRNMPAGMLFLRCEGGISHHPAENVREDDVAAALEAGLTFLDELALAQS